MKLPKESDQFYDHTMNVLEGKISQAKTRLSESDIFSREEFNLLFKLSPDVFCICDFSKLGYLYMSENVTEIMGYALEDFYKHGLKFSLTHFAAVHQPILIEKVFPEMFEYFSMYPEPGRLRFSYESMMTSAAGVNKWFLHRLGVLEVDDNQKPVLVSEYMTDIHSIKKDDVINVIITCRNEEGIFEVIREDRIFPADVSVLLTRQELKILKLIALGKPSFEIANMLCLSIHTVNNHRKNMLRKNNVRNHTELIAMAKEQKLLG